MSQVPTQRNLLSLIQAQQPAIAMAIGGRTPEERTRRADRFVRICLTAVRKTPKLMQCTPQSFLAAMMICAQLDLEPNTPQGLAYLIPYKTECTFQVGYKGLLQLAYRSGMVQSFNAEVVYRKEVEAGMFEYHKGINPTIRHDVNFLNPSLREGEIVAAYAACTLVGGQPLLRVIDAQDVARAKASSASARNGSSPWVTHEASMWMKTAIKRLASWMPQTEMLALAVDSDDRTERGEALVTAIEEAQPVDNLTVLNNALQNNQFEQPVIETANTEPEPTPQPDPEPVQEPAPQQPEAVQPPAAPKTAAKRAPRAKSASANTPQQQNAAPSPTTQPQSRSSSPAEAEATFDPRAQVRDNVTTRFDDMSEDLGCDRMDVLSGVFNWYIKAFGGTVMTAKAYFLEHVSEFQNIYKQILERLAAENKQLLDRRAAENRPAPTATPQSQPVEYADAL